MECPRPGLGGSMSAQSYEGAVVADLVRQTGLSLWAVKDRLNKAGYGVSEGIAYKRKSAQEAQDVILARIAARPPVAPCPRCGAARDCAHRIPAWGEAA